MGEQAALRLPGYEVREILHHGGTLLVYRAVRWADRHPVVVKRSLGSPVSARQLARYRNELDLLRSLDLPEVVKVWAEGSSTSRKKVFHPCGFLAVPWWVAIWNCPAT